MKSSEIINPEKEIKNIARFLRKVFSRITSLADDTDIPGTIEGIESGIVMTGSNLWILICSTFIACIGLDTNSPAVIIGAMLISPLMSPILGIGLSVGINDKSTLALSIRNFLVAIGLSLLVSVVYFSFTPYGDFTDEMKARTEPTILDAFVAFFGGLAGIIAGSRTNKTNAIPGVAIATALMPPLCTSGFGLVTGRIEVFGGAFYLFFINAVLISLSTYAIVRFLRFPVAEPVDPEAARRNKIKVYLFLMVLLIPSIFFLVKSLRDYSRDNIIRSFIKNNIHIDVDRGAEYNFEELDSLGLLKVYYFGKYIEEDSVRKLESKLMGDFTSSPLLRVLFPTSCTIELTPTDAPPDEEKKQMNEAIADLKTKVVILQQKQTLDMAKKDSVIRSELSEIELKKLEVDSLSKVIAAIKGDTLGFFSIQQEIKAVYPEIDFFSLSEAQIAEYDSSRVGTNYLAVVKWNKALKSAWVRKERQKRISNFLSIKLKSPNVRVVTEE